MGALHQTKRFFLVLLTGLLITPVLQAQNLYRYTNDDGVQVIDDQIPPEYVPNGYDILNHDGTLIQRVPRQLTEEELLLRNTKESRERLRKEEEAKMRAWDESLMLRYSSIEDIEAASERSTRDLKIRISILKSNLLSVKGQIERQQGKAADIERRGREVPDNLLQNIESLKQEIEDIEESILHREGEIDTVKASYQRDMDRFITLQDRLKLRR